MKTQSVSLMRALALTGAITCGVAACDVDKILRVEPAGLIPAVPIETPANAALLVAGAAADFDCAFNSFVAVGALITGEFVDALQTADRWPYHQRTVAPNQGRYSTNSCTALGMWAPQHGARVSANNIRRLMEGWTDVDVPGRQLLIARAAAYEAWSQLMLAESFQEVVFSTVSGETVNWAPAISRSQALDSAIVRFGQAITVAATIPTAAGDSIRFFALAGRARAYLDKAYAASATTPDIPSLTSAKDDALLVPAAFVWNVTASGTTGRRNNRVFQESNPTVTQQSSSVGPYYRTIGRQTGTTTGDPRVAIQNMNRVSNGTAVPQWAQLKYGAVSTSLPVTSGTEMRLIVAEWEARAGTRANALATIATFRTAGAQVAYTGTTLAEDMAEIQDQRRRALWLTGTYFGDVIRYDITLTPSAGTMAPWGQQYGPAGGRQQLLPLPDVERLNNPLLL